MGPFGKRKAMQNAEETGGHFVLVVELDMLNSKFRYLMQYLVRRLFYLKSVMSTIPRLSLAISSIYEYYIVV